MFGQRKKRAPLEGRMALMITPMADIFTLLLVFLLKSFSTGVSSITPSGSITLPNATEPSATVEATKMEISSSSLLLEERKILSFQGFSFLANDPLGNASLGLLANSLQRVRNRSQGVSQSSSAILILADKKTPFGLLRRILAVATQAGFLDYKLLVVEED